MKIINIKDYLGSLEDNESSKIIANNFSGQSLKLTEIARTAYKEISEREKGMIALLNPSQNYCVVSIGQFHMPSVVKKLQDLGYKTEIFLPKKSRFSASIGELEKEKLLEGLEKTSCSPKRSMVIGDIHTMIYSLKGILEEPEELKERGISRMSICLEHSKPGNEEKYLFGKKGKHCFHIYDEIQEYAEKCRNSGIKLELLGMECREDGREIC